MFRFFKRRQPAPPRLPMFRALPVHPTDARLNGITEAAIWLSRLPATDQAAVLSLLDEPLRNRVLAEQAMLPPPSQFPAETVETALRNMGYALYQAGEKADPDMGVITDSQGRQIMAGPSFEPQFPLDTSDTRNSIALNLAFQEMLARTWIRSYGCEPVRLIETEAGRLLLEAEVSTGYLDITEDTTRTDLRDVIAWVKAYRPDLLAD
jgi:hypothetical protein